MIMTGFDAIKAVFPVTQKMSVKDTNSLWVLSPWSFWWFALLVGNGEGEGLTLEVPEQVGRVGPGASYQGTRVLINPKWAGRTWNF